MGDINIILIIMMNLGGEEWIWSITLLLLPSSSSSSSFVNASSIVCRSSEKSCAVPMEILFVVQTQDGTFENGERRGRSLRISLFFSSALSLGVCVCVCVCGIWHSCFGWWLKFSLLALGMVGIWHSGFRSDFKA